MQPGLKSYFGGLTQLSTETGHMSKSDRESKLSFNRLGYGCLTHTQTLTKYNPI